MPDKIELKVGKIGSEAVNVRLEHFLSYQIDADIYTPADAFHLQLANPEENIKAGMRCELFINGMKELTGIIDKVHRRVNKDGVSLAVEGRDLMGLLVDSYCEKFISVSGKKLKELAEIMLADVPFINRKNIIYEQNVVGKLKKKGGKQASSGGYLDLRDEPQKISQIEPGMKILDVLKTYAMSRGMLFYALPDGTMVFGRPKVKGEPLYDLRILKSGQGNNVIEAERIEDISKRYSKVTVMGQQQGQDEHGTSATKVNTKNAVEDETFPFYKPFVTKNNNDSVSPKEHARMIMEKQRREGDQYIYKVARHTQSNKNWMINELCRLRDDVNGLDGVYLIYGRTFELNKEEGPTTRLKLGQPGIIA